MRKILLSISFATSAIVGLSQITSDDDVAGRVGDRYIQSSTPFLLIAPDARAAGMADVGAATSPDVNSSHWNAAKLVFIEGENGQLADFGGSLSYTPWLRKLIDDMSLNYFSAYKRLKKEEVVGFSLNFFNLGRMTFRDESNTILGEGRPFELSMKFDYSRKLSDNMSASLGMKWIHSNLASGTQLTNGDVAQAGNSIAADLGFYWNKDVVIAGEKLDLAFGGSISNIGRKISYTSREQAYFIPTNLRIGTSVTKDIDLYNKITLAIDVNKLMVPTPPEYSVDSSGTRTVIGTDPTQRGLVAGMFGSFADAPGGFSEELSEFQISTALEYWYASAFAARAGYFHESEIKGNRKFFTLGAGVRWTQYGLDFAYLIPIRQSNPLADTIRLSLFANLKSKKLKEPDTVN